MSRRAKPLLTLALLLGACSDTESGKRPNVLLVSIDTLRADHVSAYGYGRETTPELDALAAEGVRFERCISSTSWTLPAHLTMLTGLPISAHGVCDDRLWTRVQNGKPLPVPLRGRFISEALDEAGYATAGFYSWKYLDDQFGFGPGFETWEWLGHKFFTHPEVGPEFQRLQDAGDVDGMKALLAKHPELFDDAHPSSPEVIDAALAWLDERKADDPFFLFVHLFDAHDPYVPPAPFDTRFDPDYSGPIDGRRITTPDSPVRADMAPRDLENLVARYDGGIAYVDSELGRLFAALERLGLKEDTLVLVTSDHGEEFFEHGHKTHRRQLHLESVGVPLIARWPGELPADTVVPGTVGLVDVAPTIAAACGVELGTASPGLSLLPFARGEAENGERTYTSLLLLFGDAPGAPERLVALTRGAQRDFLSTRGTAPWTGVRFDLALDPTESGAGTPLVADVYEPALAGVRTALGRLRTGLPQRSGSLPPLSAHDRRQLAAMGYSSADGEFGEGDANRLCIDGCVWPDE
ncbi:MAG: sulfatase [bacterium]|nr:sulfatase [bacterium]